MDFRAEMTDALGLMVALAPFSAKGQVVSGTTGLSRFDHRIARRMDSAEKRVMETPEAFGIPLIPLGATKRH